MLGFIVVALLGAAPQQPGRDVPMLVATDRIGPDQNRSCHVDVVNEYSQRAVAWVVESGRAGRRSGSSTDLIHIPANWVAPGQKVRRPVGCLGDEAPSWRAVAVQYEDGTIQGNRALLERDVLSRRRRLAGGLRELAVVLPRTHLPAREMSMPARFVELIEHLDNPRINRDAKHAAVLSIGNIERRPLASSIVGDERLLRAALIAEIERILAQIESIRD